MSRLSVITILLLVGLAVWYHDKYNRPAMVQSSDKTNNELVEVRRKSETLTEGGERDLPPSVSPQPVAPEVCQILKAQGSAVSFSELRSQLEQKLGNPSSEMTNWENTHLITAAGDKLRLRLIRVSDVQPGRAELQLFGVDKEDLPIPKRIPKADQFDPNRDTIKRYKSLGRIEHVQKEMAFTWPDGSAMKAQIEDGRLKELEGTLRGTAITCSQTQCSCGK